MINLLNSNVNMSTSISSLSNSDGSRNVNTTPNLIVSNPISLNTGDFQSSQLYQNTSTLVDSVNSVISNLNHKHAMGYLDTSLNLTSTFVNNDVIKFKDILSDPFNCFNKESGVIRCPVSGLLTIRLNGYTINGGMDLQIVANISSLSGDATYKVFRCYATATYYTVVSNFAYLGKEGDEIKLVVLSPSTVTFPYDLQLSLTWG